ncbi:hypothetical protein [Pseudomonas oryzihabitans]|uniref:hypothetical protein n=1 Tax=Pseudomonas oryzihabitans TaxID=47885 RepID=UPI0028945164|nr:hypothetical protein [Pseudomonas oryzihabitans]MDT3721394.1 hypothetical protein [Pseudomonas oryzihabitans]
MTHHDLPPAGFRRRRETQPPGPWLDLAASSADHLVLVDTHGQRYRIPVKDVCAALIEAPARTSSR